MRSSECQRLFQLEVSETRKKVECTPILNQVLLRCSMPALRRLAVVKLLPSLLGPRLLTRRTP